MMKKMILLLSLVAGTAYAMAGKGVTLEDLNVVAQQWNKDKDIDVMSGFALSCIAVNLLEEEAEKNSAAKSPEARAAFLQNRYNH